MFLEFQPGFYEQGEKRFPTIPNTVTWDIFGYFSPPTTDRMLY
jgi:hypothetical protein